MAELLIDFEWWRDAKGYRMADSERPELEPALEYHPLGIRVLSSKPLRVYRLGGELKPYRPLDRFASLFKQFADGAKSPAGLLDFIVKFGPLTEDGLDETFGEPVQGIIAHAETMNDFLHYASGDRKRLSWLIGSQVNPLSEVEVGLVLDPTTQVPKLRLSPHSLLDALWMQLGQSLSGGTNIRQCQHCGAWFETGPGTGRRLDAKFCSDEHRITFNSLKRSKEK